MEPTGKSNPTLISSAKKSRLNYNLWKIHQSLSKKDATFNITLPNYVSFEKNKDGIVTKINPPSLFQINFGALSISDVDLDEESEYKPQTYITLGTLLSLITSTLSIGGKNSEENITPYILFDINPNNDDNYMATFPGNFSSDPNVCLIPYQPISPDITKGLKLPNTIVNKILQRAGSNFFSVDGNPLIGRIINIYVNINFIIKTFESSINENDEVILIDFLKNILTGINNSLGGLNNFRVLHNKDTNLFEILSETPLNLKPNPEPHTINTFGVVKGAGSFVREMDLNSELTDKYANMVTIGAQANGNVSQTNSTAFSIYNKGLVDRVIKEKVDITRTDNNDSESKIKDLFTDDIKICFNSIYNEKKFTNKNISVLQNINSQYCKLATGNLTQKRKYPSPVFLPFNLSLTMDGLSGMKIYQSFKIDGKALPLTYNAENIQLIIKSLSHNISSDGWLTKVETIAGPIFNIDQNISQGTYSESGQIETPAIANNVAAERITPAETENNIVITKQYFEQRGFSPVQISAIIGALLQESRLNPNAKNSIGAYGIAQWLGDRRNKLLAKPNYSNLRTQLDYIVEEFNSTEKISGNRLKKATTLEEAIAAMAGYERYGGIKGQSPSFEDVLRAPETGNRIGFAKNIFNRYQTIGSAKSDPFNLNPQIQMPNM